MNIYMALLKQNSLCT